MKDSQQTKLDNVQLKCLAVHLSQANPQSLGLQTKSTLSEKLIGISLVVLTLMTFMAMIAILLPHGFTQLIGMAL